MNQTQAEKDRDFSFSIINYLSASYRGKLAGYTLLGQLEHPSFDVDEINGLMSSTERISEWFSGFLRGELLFSASWSNPETFEAQNALSLLTKVKPDLIQLTSRIEDIIEGKETLNSQNAKWLFHVLARSSFARDVYLRGFVVYGESYKKHEMTRYYSEMLQNAAQYNDLVQQGIEIFRGAQYDLSKLGEDFLITLMNSCEELPAIYKTHVHDINLLACNFQGGLTFENVDFGEKDALEWKAKNFTPDAAGYWRAYGFTAEASALWVDSFLVEPAEALAWGRSGFTPEIAKPWRQLGFPLDLAKPWQQAGYRPDKAKEQIERGVTMPPEEV